MDTFALEHGLSVVNWHDKVLKKHQYVYLTFLFAIQMVFTSDPHKNYLLVQINSSDEKESSKGQQAFIYVSILYGFLLKYHYSSLYYNSCTALHNADLGSLHLSEKIGSLFIKQSQKANVLT